MMALLNAFSSFEGAVLIGLVMSVMYWLLFMVVTWGGDAEAAAAGAIFGFIFGFLIAIISTDVSSPLPPGIIMAIAMLFLRRVFKSVRIKSVNQCC